MSLLELLEDILPNDLSELVHDLWNHLYFELLSLSGGQLDELDVGLQNSLLVSLVGFLRDIPVVGSRLIRRLLDGRLQVVRQAIEELVVDN